MMLPLARLRLFTAAASVLLGSGALGYAETVATDPVGFVTIAVPANSDTYVNVPLKQTTGFAGVAGALAVNGQYDAGEPYVDANQNGIYDAGETYTDTKNTITIANSPNFTASQFVYSSPAQKKHFFVFIGSGARAGSFFTVLSNTTSAVTVDLAGDNIDTALTFGTGATPLQIIPYDTLGSIFPAGQGVVGSPIHGFGGRQTEVLIPDQQTAGIDLGASSIYYYYSGTVGAGAGWRRDGNINTVADDDILYPDNFFIIRTKAGAASTLTMMGGVQMSTLQAPLSTLAANKAQDNAVALPIAASMSLAQTKLFESNAFAPSISHGFGDRGDQVLLFDNTVIGHDKGPAKVYYYFTGTNPGWRLDGSDTTVVRDNDIVISPTTAIIVRKKAATNAGTAFWSVKPPYVP